MKEHARFLELMAQADGYARELDALGPQLRAMGAVDILISLDDIRDDIARIETTHHLHAFALRA